MRKTKRILVECLECGKAFEKPAWRLVIRPRHFCSTEHAMRWCGRNRKFTVRSK